jgi:hypothetical protein
MTRVFQIAHVNLNAPARSWRSHITTACSE